MVVTISRNFTSTANPETGVVFFNGRRDATREVLSRARAMFEAPKTHWRPGNPVTAGISDVHVYRRLLIDKPPRSARMGWFAAKPCGNTTKTVLERMRGYQVDFRDLHCPGARDDVSPFQACFAWFGVRGCRSAQLTANKRADRIAGGDAKRVAQDGIFEIGVEDDPARAGDLVDSLAHGKRHRVAPGVGRGHHQVDVGRGLWVNTLGCEVVI